MALFFVLAIEEKKLFPWKLVKMQIRHYDWCNRRCTVKGFQSFSMVNAVKNMVFSLCGFWQLKLSWRIFLHVILFGMSNVKWNAPTSWEGTFNRLLTKNILKKNKTHPELKQNCLVEVVVFVPDDSVVAPQMNTVAEFFLFELNSVLNCYYFHHFLVNWCSSYFPRRSHCTFPCLTFLLPLFLFFFFCGAGGHRHFLSLKKYTTSLKYSLFSKKQLKIN